MACISRKRREATSTTRFLTSLIDRQGTLRVQYMGVRFDPEEMLRDLRSLLDERAAR